MWKIKLNKKKYDCVLAQLFFDKQERRLLFFVVLCFLLLIMVETRLALFA